MPTKKQNEANRRNAQRSTGPKTPATKAASCHNALTHGLLASDLTVLVNPAARAAAAALLQDFNDFYLPRTPIERALLRQMAILQHRLEAAPAIESGILTEGAFSQFKDALADAATFQDPEKQRSWRNRVLGNTFASDCEGPNAIPKLVRYETALSNRFLKCVDRFLRSRQAGPEKPSEAQPSEAPPGEDESLAPHNDSSQIAQVLPVSTPELPNEPNFDLTLIASSISGVSPEPPAASAAASHPPPRCEPPATHPPPRERPSSPARSIPTGGIPDASFEPRA